MQTKRDRGFTLLEVLVVVAIIAIVAAIAIVSYRASLERARQKRTVADIRMIALAWEARAADTQTYAISGYTFPPFPVTYEKLNENLSPTYARNLPRYDAWGRALDFGFIGPKDYAIRSPGRDGVLQGPDYAPGETDDPDCDIVFSSGNFVTYPVAVKGK